MICRSSLVRKSYSSVRGPAIIFVCLFIYMLKMKLASWIFLFLLRLHSNGRQYAILPGMSTYTWSVHLSTSWIFSSLIHSFNWMKCWVNWLTTCPMMKDVQKQIFIFIKKFPWFNFEIIKQIFIVTLLVRNISISGVIFLLAYSWDGIKPIFHSLKSSAFCVFGWRYMMRNNISFTYSGAFWCMNTAGRNYLFPRRKYLLNGNIFISLKNHKKGQERWNDITIIYTGFLEGRISLFQQNICIDFKALNFVIFYNFTNIFINTYISCIAFSLKTLAKMKIIW